MLCLLKINMLDYYTCKLAVCTIDIYIVFIVFRLMKTVPSLFAPGPIRSLERIGQ